MRLTRRRGGRPSGLITEAASWAALKAAVLAAGDGAVGALNQGHGEICRACNVGGVLYFVRNKIALGFVDDAAPAFSIGAAGSGADIIYTRTGASAPTWGDVGAETGGLIMSEGVVHLAFLDFLNLSALGVALAAADFEPTVTTAVDNQILAAVGFLKATETQAIMGAIAREGSAWRSTYLYGDPTSALSAKNKLSSVYDKPNAEDSTITAFWVSALARLTSNHQAQLAGGMAGDETSVSHDSHHVNESDTLSNQDTAWRLALCVDRLGGSISSRCTSVSWHTHERPGGATP